MPDGVCNPQTTHASISEVVKQAIDFYYERSKRTQTKTSAEILLHSGFVGCGEAEPRANPFIPLIPVLHL
ncbi:MAG: hypothetical protein ABFS56_19630 [Pseudomonadota bacterium]